MTVKFKHFRIIEENEIVAIFVDDFASEPIDGSDVGSAPRVVYFKVVGVEPKTEGATAYIADSDNSMLVLVKSCNVKQLYEIYCYT